MACHRHKTETAIGTRQIGFCVDPEGRAALLAAGMADKDIYQRGRMAETLARAIERFRGFPGTLKVAGDLSCFGETQREVAAQISGCEKRRIHVVDVRHLEDDTIAAMQRRAFLAISRPRFTDKRKARRHGKRGGEIRAAKAAARRSALIAGHIVVAMMAHPKLTKRDVAEITGISLGVLQRHYKP